MIHTAKTHKKLATAVIAGAVVTGGIAGSAVTKNSKKIDANQETLITACEASLSKGPPIGVRRFLAEDAGRDIRANARQVAQTRRTPPSFFPDIPPEKFRKLIRASIMEIKRQTRELRRDKGQLLRVDCEEQYRP